LAWAQDFPYFQAETSPFVARCLATVTADSFTRLSPGFHRQLVGSFSHPYLNSKTATNNGGHERLM
jgi:hypothetical protein